MSRRFVSVSVMVAAIVALTATVGVKGQERAIATFFDDFSADWMRRRPSQTTQSRYFTGEEQDRLFVKLLQVLTSDPR